MFQPRLQKECSQLSKEKYEITLKENSCLIRFYTPHHRLMTLEINEAYPFKSPVVRQNGVLYGIVPQDMVLLRVYKDRYQECGCICCHNICSRDRWGPCFTIEKIIQGIVSREQKWHEVAFSHVSTCFQTLPVDIQHVISEFL